MKPALVNLKANSPEYITTSKEFIGAWKLSGAKPVITKIELIKAPYLEELFKPMELELEKKLVSTGRRTLYHGTHEANLPRVLTHGLSPPSDYEVSPNCKAWGHIKMASSPCTLECQECAGQNAVRHKWNKCHMFGLGIYFADQSSKSDRYVSRPDGAPVEKERKMLVVEVLLGSCYEIQELKTPDQLHDYVAAPDGYDSIMAIGTSTAKQGLQVLNNECTYSL